MINTFKSKRAQKIFDGELTSKEKARRVKDYDIVVRKMDMLNAVASLSDLMLSSGSTREEKEKRTGKLSVKAGDKSKIVFVFKNNNVFEVDIVDSKRSKYDVA